MKSELKRKYKSIRTDLRQAGRRWDSNCGDNVAVFQRARICGSLDGSANILRLSKDRLHGKDSGVDEVNFDEHRTTGEVVGGLVQNSCVGCDLHWLSGLDSVGVDVNGVDLLQPKGARKERHGRVKRKNVGASLK
jgi:hypothetical protein